MISSLEKEKPSFILIAGDFFHRSGLFYEDLHEDFSNQQAEHLYTLNKIAPVIMSRGNHESHLTYEDKIKIAHSGAILLDNEYKIIDGIAFGGLTSEIVYDYINKDRIKYNHVDADFIERFSSLKNYKILLCHHPEYRDRYFKDKDIDLIVCGHAHGGQIRIFNQGLFAPGQGTLPKYTSGVHGNMIISRGLANTTKIPRLFNDIELVYINI